MSLRWPRGRYNGQKIVGFSTRVNVNVIFWRCNLYCRYGEFKLWLGPFLLHIEPIYAWS